MHTQKENAQDFLVLTAKGEVRKAFAFYAVSYTHLDVYKRQGQQLDSAAIIVSLVTLRCENGFIFV